MLGAAHIAQLYMRHCIEASREKNAENTKWWCKSSLQDRTRMRHGKVTSCAMESRQSESGKAIFGLSVKPVSLLSIIVTAEIGLLHMWPLL